MHVHVTVAIYIYRAFMQLAQYYMIIIIIAIKTSNLYFCDIYIVNYMYHSVSQQEVAH